MNSFYLLALDKEKTPIVKQTVEFKDANDEYFTIITSTIKSVSRIGRQTYLNLFDKESIEINTDYDQARQILDEALRPPTEYYIATDKFMCTHHIPVTTVLNVTEGNNGIEVYTQKYEYAFPGTTAKEFFASKTIINT